MFEIFIVILLLLLVGGIVLRVTLKVHGDR